MTHSGVPVRSRPPLRRRPRPIFRLALALLLVAALIALAAFWSFSPLARSFDVHAIAAHAQQVRSWPMAPLAAIALFVAGGLVAAPGTLMIGATVVVFGPWPGALYAFVGMMANGLVVYAIGRYAARDMVDAWLARRTGSKLDGFNRLLARRGIVAVALMRVTPLPYSLQNVMAGVARIRLADFVLGTPIGLIPVFVVMTSLATGFDRWLANPAWGGFAVLLSIALAGAALLWWLKRRMRSVVREADGATRREP